MVYMYSHICVLEICPFAQKGFIFQKSWTIAPEQPFKRTKHCESCGWLRILSFVARKQNIKEKMASMFSLCLNRWKNKCIYLSLAFHHTADAFLSETRIGICSCFDPGPLLKIQRLTRGFQVHVWNKKPVSGMNCSSSAITPKKKKKITKTE